MKVLVACEYSGRVRDAFLQHGHEAMSCDLLPTEVPGPHHQGDVREILDQGWDLLIAHPPCTYLASSGLHWNKRVPGRARLTDEALDFVRLLLDAPIPRIALENPIGCISSRIRKPDQIIQPWMFGEDASKATCLWLKGLPTLAPTHVIKKQRYANQTPSGQNKLPPGPDRWKDRSRTYHGVAAAMSTQWSNAVCTTNPTTHQGAIMTQLIPFDSATAVATRKPRFAVTADLITSSGGFPIVSIKGKVFHIRRGDESTLITRPGSEDPAASIEVVILGVAPGAGKTAKNYYGTAYVEGSDAKPLCYSVDGDAPAADAQEPQAKSCAVCPHAAWGSRITEDGKQGKACADSKRLAIASLDALADPLLIRVPAASLKTLSEYNKQLVARGYAYQEIVTRIGFDYTVAHPALTFKPVAIISDDATLDQIEAAMTLDVTQDILGVNIASRVPALPPPGDEVNRAAATAASADAAEKTAQAEAKAAAAEAVEAAAPKRPRAAKPAAEVKAPAAKVETPQTVSADEGLAAALDDLDFDD